MTDAKPLTGRKVLFITLAAFGTIFAANMALLVSAVGTFPGLEVKNTYVASQKFDAERAAQEALGWNAATEYADGQLRIQLIDDYGNKVPTKALSVMVGRTTHARDDQVLEMSTTGQMLTAPVALEPGNWQVRLTATALDDTLYKVRLPLYVTAPGNG